MERWTFDSSKRLNELANQFFSAQENCKYFTALMDYLFDFTALSFADEELVKLIELTLVFIPRNHNKIRKHPHETACFSVAKRAKKHR